MSGRVMPLSVHVLGADQLTIARERIQGAVKKLVADGHLSSDGFTPTQIEAALWCWVDRRIDALLDDLVDEIEDRRTSTDFEGFLERAALTRDTLDGTAPKEVATVSTSRWVGHGDDRRFINSHIEYRVGELVEYAGRARAIHAIHETEYGHQYLTLAGDDGAWVYVSPALAQKVPVVSYEDATCRECGGATQVPMGAQHHVCPDCVAVPA